MSVVGKVAQNLVGEHGIAIADAALMSLKERKITPSPENYAVWLAFHSSVPADLRVELEMMIAAKRVIDDHICDQLYIKYFEDLAIGSRMMKAGGKIAAEMEDGALRDRGGPDALRLFAALVRTTHDEGLAKSAMPDQRRIRL
jgi:hypothetical protein